MPTNCGLVSEDSYAAKHNPAVYYVGPGDRAACQADDVPFSASPAVLTSGGLPTYTSITPNICDDMHDCSVTSASVAGHLGSSDSRHFLVPLRDHRTVHHLG